MAESRYGNLIHTTDLIADIPHYTGYSMVSHKGELNQDCSIGYHCITQPFCFEKPHAHDFTEMLFFFGGDPTDIRELGAEIEITLGEEQEKHVITKAGVVVIPPGLVHCPIDIRNVSPSLKSPSPAFTTRIRTKKKLAKSKNENNSNGCFRTAGRKC